MERMEHLYTVELVDHFTASMANHFCIAAASPLEALELFVVAMQAVCSSHPSSLQQLPKLHG